MLKREKLCEYAYVAVLQYVDFCIYMCTQCLNNVHMHIHCICKCACTYTGIILSNAYKENYAFQ